MSQQPSEARPPSAPPAPASDALAALRQATHERHARLDAHLPIARPDATLGDFAAHAAALHTWLATLAPELRQLAAHETRYDPDLAHRLQLLRADLQDAGHALPPGAPAPSSPGALAQIRQALQAFPRAPHAVRWGLAYVLEGSQLGGHVMHGRLAQRLAPHPLRYFRGRGAAATGAHWKAFIALLRTRLASPEAIAAACSGAQAGFAGLELQLPALTPRTP